MTVRGPTDVCAVRVTVTDVLFGVENVTTGPATVDVPGVPRGNVQE